ncbi:D-glycero-beta-D-manno-heptose 1-phosphate adenylyltransferase [bacterium]|nr:D-glycero-beta-D-manno-heptose 1-phosphate adenylyltransferase [bacterium]
MVSGILSLPALRRRLAADRRAGRRVVFTNGVFDLLHPGHVRYLRAARRLGDVLVVGLNSDRSARRLHKGPGRPLVRARDRAEVLAALEMVDYVTIFDQDTPYELIRAAQPDVLVKGGDWTVDRIVGADLVLARGGSVKSLRFAPGYSTTRLVETIATRARRGARRTT